MGDGFERLVALDDDPEALSEMLSELGKPSLIFSKISEFAQWLEESADFTKTLFIYDLHLNPGSGLDVLVNSPWPEQSVLFTDDYLDPESVRASSEMGFKIVPKGLLRYPIREKVESQLLQAEHAVQPISL